MFQSRDGQGVNEETAAARSDPNHLITKQQIRGALVRTTQKQQALWVTLECL